MTTTPLTRRTFARALGTTLAGSLVAGRAGAALPATAAARASAPGAGARPVRLDSNESPYGPSPRALAAMERSLADAARYPDTIEDDLIAALAKLHGVTSAGVILGCGSGEILRIADMSFLGPGKTLVSAEPTFEAVLEYARVTRARAIKVPLTAEFRHDLPRMAEACGPDTGLIYVCNPNNPTGTIVGRDELAAFVERVPRTAVILIDEAYHHFVEDARYGTAVDLLGAHANVLVVRTFSKIYGLAGMRLGYAVASPDLITRMQAHRIWSNANIAVLEAALASVADDTLVPRLRREFAATRRWLRDEMAKDGRRVIPSQTNFVMLDVGSDVAPVIAALRERGVRPGRRFPSLPHWLRVSIGTPGEMRAFVTALRAVLPADRAGADAAGSS